jgi:gliding motility-associated-like protein
MKKCLSYISILVLFFTWQGNIYSQAPCITDPPLSPLLTSVSVNPETGNTLFTWNSSPSTGIAAYILYSYKNGDGFALDTIKDPSATSYTLVSTATKYFSVSYVVAAMRLPRCTSILSNALKSVYEDVTIDTCNKKISVSWNKYMSVPLKVNGYTVLMSVNNGIYTEAANLGAADSSFTLNDFTLNASYCFVVRANIEGGKSSFSNKKCISTKMQRQPLWINADQATINDAGKISLSFTIDPLSQITHFSLERKRGSNGVFNEIAHLVSNSGTVQYTDSQASTDTINYYRLSAVNSCNLPVLTSNLASNIVLSMERSVNDISFSWNPYKSWAGQISSYKLFVNTGSGFSQVAEISSADTSYIFDYKQIMYEVTGKEVCFYISATEQSNPYGISGKSSSGKICSSPGETITVPNLFTPNNDLKNDLFRPVVSFTPADYHLIISDRRGSIVFETRDWLKEWDGTHNGDPQAEGVYLWLLKLSTPSGKTISRTGTVTILRSK